MVKALPENIVKESDIAGKGAENALKQCWAIFYRLHFPSPGKQTESAARRHAGAVFACDPQRRGSGYGLSAAR